MTETIFNKGDVVRSKTGGCLMTIDTIGDHLGLGYNLASCVWFDHEIKPQLHRNNFDFAYLLKVNHAI